MAGGRKHKAAEQPDGGSPRVKRRSATGEKQARAAPRRDGRRDVSEGNEDEVEEEENRVTATSTRPRNQQARPGSDYISSLRQRIEQQQATLDTVIEQRRKEIAAEGASIRSSILSRLPPDVRRNLLAASDLQHNASTATSEVPLNPLYSILSSVLQKSHRAIEIYGQAAELIEKSRPARRPDVGWKEDAERVAMLLEAGKRIAEREIREVFRTRGDVGTQMLEVEEVATADAEAVAIFGREFDTRERTGAKAGNMGSEWAKTLAQMEKGVKTIVKGLPDDVQ